MNLENIISKVKELKPTLEEVKEKYLGIDSEGANAILRTFDLAYNAVKVNFSNIIEELVTCTNIYEMVWAGIQFNNKYDALPSEIALGYEFAGFNDCVLALETSSKEIIYVNFYEPNQNYIEFRCAKSPDKFIDMMLYLLEIDLGFQFRNKALDDDITEKLIGLAGGDSYRLFCEFIIKSYS